MEADLPGLNYKHPARREGLVIGYQHNQNLTIDIDLIVQSQLATFTTFLLAIDRDESILHHHFGLATCGRIPRCLQQLKQVDELGLQSKLFFDHLQPNRFGSASTIIAITAS